MKKARERFKQYCEAKFQQVCNQLLDIAITKQDYPDFDPDRAEELTRWMIASGRLAFDTPDHPAKGLCV